MLVEFLDVDNDSNWVASDFVLKVTNFRGTSSGVVVAGYSSITMRDGGIVVIKGNPAEVAEALNDAEDRKRYGSVAD